MGVAYTKWGGFLYIFLNFFRERGVAETKFCQSIWWGSLHEGGSLQERIRYMYILHTLSVFTVLKHMYMYVCTRTPTAQLSIVCLKYTYLILGSILSTLQVYLTQVYLAKTA